MKFKTETTLFISRKELRAAAQFQDQLAGLQAQIKEHFGVSPVVRTLSVWEQVKIALGQKKFETHGPLTVGYSRAGVTLVLKIDEEVPEEVTTESFKAYGDIVAMFAPVITSALLGLSLASSMADKRWEKAERKISKALAKQ